MKAEQKKSNNGTEEDSGKSSTVLLSDVDHDLIEFENWATNEANVVIHPSVRVVNNNNKEKSMGCQIRTFNGDMKKGEVLMTVPRHAMVTPDLVAASDAGRAILACCCEQKEHYDDMETTTTEAADSLRQQIQEEGGANKSTTKTTTSSVSSYWDAFENTVICEQKFLQQIGRDSGTQLSFRILQERKRAEMTYSNKMGDTTTTATTKLAEHGIISTRAVFLAFLIHQRFHPNARPPIILSEASSNRDFDNLPENCALNLSTQKNIVLDDGTPKTFGPYAQILPQSISLPICWNQDQLALLETVTGFTLLQEICCSTIQLTTEFIALIEAGILWRFPQIFPKGLLTWERWLWAASCFTSRILPMECYINNSNITNIDDDDDDVKCSTSDDAQHMMLLQSPREIWAELGVMIPVLDMLNHDIELQSVKWESPNMNKPATRNGSSEEEEEKKKEAGVVSSEHDHPRAIMEKDVLKGQQIFTCYGNELSNRLLVLQYGFAQVGNDSDELSIGWGLMDAVGSVELPSSVTTYYSSLLIDNDKPGDDHNDETTKCLVYDSTEQEAIMKWWSEDRLILLERALPNVGESFVSSLKMGEKMMSAAHAEGGTYDPCLLTTAVYGTMPVSDLQHGIEKYEEHKSNGQLPVSISKRHQYILRNYLVFFFSRKLEKMLQHLSETLKDSIPGAARLWTKATEGGLRYMKNDQNNDSDEIERDDDASKRFIGWRALFEENAKRVNGEKTSYTVDPKSCVFALYDGHLKALQSSVDDLLTLEKFDDSVLSHLVQLGFVIESEDTETLEVTNEEEKTEHTDDIARDSKKEEEGNPIPSKRSRLK